MIRSSWKASLFLTFCLSSFWLHSLSSLLLQVDLAGGQAGLIAEHHPSDLEDDHDPDGDLALPQWGAEAYPADRTEKVLKACPAAPSLHLPPLLPPPNFA